MDIRFGTWNVRSLYRAGSLTAAVRELERYKLNLVGVQEVRCNKGAMVRAGDYIFSVEKETKIINWERDFFVHHRILSEIKRGEFVSDTVSYIVLRGRRCNIIVLNVRAPSEEKICLFKTDFMRN